MEIFKIEEVELKEDKPDLEQALPTEEIITTHDIQNV